MAMLTFTSDFGQEDHYVAAVKASVLRINPNIQIIDISHDVEPFNVSHAAYVLKAIYRDFPEGTVHLAALDTHTKNWGAIGTKLNDHFFIGPDNGLFSLISDNQPGTVVDINKIKPVESNFPARDIYARAAASLASGTNLQDLGPKKADWKQLLDRQIKSSKSLISGNVIRVDTYGNLITNIPKTEFDTVLGLNENKSFEIRMGREAIGRVHTGYYQVEPGDCFCIFNSLGLLEIGINSGNAANLLGLTFDSPVNIHFNQ